MAGLYGTREVVGSVGYFQELSSRPTTIVSTNCSIAYGCARGNKTTVADAIKVYIQSDLKNVHETWIEFPYELIPPEWKGIKRPCCRFFKALYGHPEAGGHWERHLRGVVKRMGGVVVESHPSCYYFEHSRLILTIYVDDLMLSGPCEGHAPFWKRLSADVKIEEPEDLERYLGRNHHIAECGRLDYDLRKEYESEVSCSNSKVD